MKDILEQLNTQREKAYEACPRDIREHAGEEEVVLAGGYGYRQVLELVQNGADAILEAHQNGQVNDDQRIEVLLTKSHLYVANTGAPLSPEGLEALLGSNLSPKRGNQIGRFGLGFKSLLRLKGIIDIFTRQHSNLRFNPERCRDYLTSKFGQTPAPGLRLAWPLDEDEKPNDSVLQEFAWAETVVRAQVNASEAWKKLEKELHKFPEEFLLFLDHPITLTLRTGNGLNNRLKVQKKGNTRILQRGETHSSWRVFSRDVHVKDLGAIEDATSIHARETIPLVWATPLDSSREESGRFWAFFPTHTPTYLPGILNAPWKLNSDRNALIPGDWNKALMLEAADLIIEHLPSLSTPEDPALPLYAFPRQLDRKDDDAAPMIKAIWSKLLDISVIPDGTGQLRYARELNRPPTDDVDLITMWQTLADGKSLKKLVHARCQTRARASRLNELATRLEDAQEEVDESNDDEEVFPYLSEMDSAYWINEVAAHEAPKAIEVLKLARAFKDESSSRDWNHIKDKLAIVPACDGSLITANQATIAPAEVTLPAGCHRVCATFLETPEASDLLTEVLEIHELGNDAWKIALDNSLPVNTWSNNWPHFWSNLRAAPVTVAEKFINDNQDQIKVKTESSHYKFYYEVLMVGEIIKAEESQGHEKVLVCADEHGQDDHLLKVLGVSHAPNTAKWVSYKRSSACLRPLLQTHRRKFEQNLTTSPRSSYLNPKELNMPDGWHLLGDLQSYPKARLTERLIDQLQECPDTYRFGHDTNAKYGEKVFEHPLPWVLLERGAIRIADEVVTLKCLMPIFRDLKKAFSFEPSLLPDLSEGIISILENSLLEVAEDENETQRFWVSMMNAVNSVGFMQDDRLTSFWSVAAANSYVPGHLASNEGPIPISEVYVTGSSDLAKRARDGNRVVVTLDERTLNGWLEHGALPLEDIVEPNWDNKTGPDLPLCSVFPELEPVIKNEVIEVARCQTVSGLRLMFEDVSEAVPCLITHEQLLCDLVQLQGLGAVKRIQRILDELASTDWLSCTLEEAKQMLADSNVQQRRSAVAAEPDPKSRLLKAVDARPGPLIEALGSIGKRPFIDDLTPKQLAELVLAHFGPATLSTLRGAMEESGLRPPGRWNTSEARAFVQSIGFPEIFATAAASRRNPEETINGPMPLPPLHDYQDEVLSGVKDLLAKPIARKRAVISLPTGGGKTRVTVESAVKLVLAPEGERRSVIWIAQSDELCEQAVQAFRQVWHNHGALYTDLRIVRLWGGNPNPIAHQELDKPLVIVASIQTLNARMAQDSLEWLNKPGLVVVDECHHAITKSYTSLLRWLDAEHHQSRDTPRDEPPILGLSATPFRMDDDESRRLANRFDNLWFPSDQAGLHQKLHSQGVLSSVDGEALASRTQLTSEELERLADFGVDSDGFEFGQWLDELNERLATVEKRNKIILDSVSTAPQQSILLFANSVSHAEELSARLNLKGVPSAVISGGTPKVARRYFLEQFQKGELRVLCNHSVLTTGFDAPRTDMLLIARQVFSPVQYMQIVGRGLRGEQNGGTARCRIVTVMDNLGRFQNRHPYHYCTDYFNSVNSLT